MRRDERIEAIESRLAAATPGPWEWGHFWDQEWIREGFGGRRFRPSLDTSYEWIPSHSDAKFIAHSPEDIKYLLDLVRKQEWALQGRRNTRLRWLALLVRMTPSAAFYCPPDHPKSPSEVSTTPRAANVS